MTDKDQLDRLVTRISAAAGVDEDAARKAIGAILAFLRKEGRREDVDELFARLPGAAEAADASAAQGGALAGLMGKMGGGLMGLAARLTGFGLGMAQMQTIGRELFAYAQERAGEERVRAVALSVPGLGQFL
ncbi:DUF2267 domain-containing protein [Methylocella sp.]|uniref:DUF2267 domain-containing protein n=1 Tax=Methylocella sp. TaxID=1978226 RepID=UPI0035B47385